MPKLKHINAKKILTTIAIGLFFCIVVVCSLYAISGFYLGNLDELLFALNIAFWLTLTWFLLIAANMNINLKILILSLTGMVIMFICTSRYGVGVDPDSVFYISAGRNLLKGLGLSLFYYGDGKLVPMTHFPPLFPALLSLFSFFGASFFSVARWLNILLFGANIWLITLIVNKYTRSVHVSFFASFLMLTSVGMLSIHSMALTEPLFIFLTISGLYLLASYFENQRLLLFIASSGLTALAFLTRYIGAATVVAGVVGIVYLSKKRMPRRVVDAHFICYYRLNPCFVLAGQKFLPYWESSR